MRLLGKTARCALIGCAALFGSIIPSAASVIDQAVGIITDPLKLGKASSDISESLERSLVQLNALEGTANAHVAERLDQIRSIIQDALKGGQDGIDHAKKAILEIEKQIDQDAIDLMYRTQCAAEVALMDQMQRAFAAYIRDLKQADPSVVILGAKIINLKVGDIQIKNPDDAYFSMKAARLAELNKNVTDTTKASTILSTYQNIERLAKLTQCHFIDTVYATRWIKERSDLEVLSVPWTTVVEPAM